VVALRLLFTVSILLWGTACRKQSSDENSPTPRPKQSVAVPKSTALSKISEQDVAAFNREIDIHGAPSEISKKFAQATREIDEELKANHYSDDDLGKISMLFKAGVVSELGFRATRQFLQRQGVAGWEKEDIVRFFGIPTREDKDKMEYVFDDGFSAATVVFWLKDGVVVKAW
jgi:hypothetical protein